MAEINENQELLKPGVIDLATATPEEIKAFAEKQMEINPQLYARAKKAEEEKKASTEALRKAALEKQSENLPKTEDEKYERLELMAKQYTDDEIDFIQKNGGKKSLENPFVKTAIENLREQRKAEAAADINGSGKGNSNIKQYSEGDLAKMSSSQLQKIIEG